MLAGKPAPKTAVGAAKGIVTEPATRGKTKNTVNPVTNNSKASSSVPSDPIGTKRDNSAPAKHPSKARETAAKAKVDNKFPQAKRDHAQENTSVTNENLLENRLQTTEDKEVSVTKQQMAALRRRKSSIGGLRNGTNRRQSSFGIGISSSATITTPHATNCVELPPASVKPADFHKHLLPDLPGPVKMRQLMVWAVQKAAHAAAPKQKKTNEGTVEVLLQGLLKNELNTSWYCRPATGQAEAKADGYKHPQNVELVDTIAQVRQYQALLRTELEVWRAFDTQPAGFGMEETHAPPAIDEVAEQLDNLSIAPLLVSATDWLASLPLAVDHLDWSLRLATAFSLRSHAFCEDTFRQIFAVFFSDDAATPPIDPMLVLKALSARSAKAKAAAAMVGRRRSSIGGMGVGGGFAAILERA